MVPGTTCFPKASLSPRRSLSRLANPLYRSARPRARWNSSQPPSTAKKRRSPSLPRLERRTFLIKKRSRYLTIQSLIKNILLLLIELHSTEETRGSMSLKWSAKKTGVWFLSMRVSSL